ncbi:serine hydrolase domain-containing protein [Flagellimonas meridianipacifica]|uniref:Beta-lactamase class C n=1 Tax=Flagellimonas meridianipacifica TaxID=1080225 RepID=A0A2T0MBB4_9FLAO|nr:serine hydrolase domain-containing protein [Allomuricauda pacifica]PRX54702.1 beta-lactamase class C [Allomuricauda pacifica]
MYRFKVFAGLASLFLFLFFFVLNGNGSVSETYAPTEAFDEDIYASLKQNARVLDKELQIAVQRAVDSYFDRAIASGEVVGAGVSIVKGKQVLLADGFGTRNSLTGKKVDGQTVFRLGSLSKGFTGILASDLKGEGKLTWEDKVSDCIPEFELGDGENTKNITLAHLLSHTSGAPYHSFTNLVEAGLSLNEIASRFAEVEPISRPGEIYSYQNALFALSGEIMERVTGQDITTSLEERFFNPLEMCATTMDFDELRKTENKAKPHVKSRHGWRSGKLTDSYFNAVAAGGINSNAEDMAKWMQFLLGHRPDVMAHEALQEAFTPFIKIPGRHKYYQRWPGHTASYYGFGWRIHTYQSNNSGVENTIWHHGGSVNHFRNEIAVFPEEDLGICVLLNNQSRIAQRVINDLYSVVKEAIQVHTSKKTPLNPVSS